MKTVEFTKDHTYGGVAVKKGDKIKLDDPRRAAMLEKAGVVAKATKAKEKAED